MKHYYFLFIFLLCQNVVHDKIIWTENRLLKKEDFRSNGITDSSYYGAGSMCYLDFKLCNTGYKVFAVFDPEESSMKGYNSDLINLELLNHEQGHFDICEIVARKARRRLSKVGTALIDNNYMVQLINKYHDSLNLLNKEYDNETLHGVHLLHQRNWDTRIQNILDSLSEYK